MDIRGARRDALHAYWLEKRATVIEASKNLWPRWLDRTRTLNAPSCYGTARLLLTDAIQQLIMDEEARAHSFLEAAQFYLETAIERDDLAAYGRVGQVEVGRSRRLRDLVIVRWLLMGTLDLDEFRGACEMKEDWNGRIFAAADWPETGFELHEWMGEQLVLGRAARARQLANLYFFDRGSALEVTVLQRMGIEAFTAVADALASGERSGLPGESEARLDAFYEHFTDWGPSFRENEVPYDEKLIYAYVRGKYFKGVEDPIRLVKMMKFSE